MSSTVITDEQAKKHIAANLARLLKMQKISQSELARRTGEARMTIWRLCRGLNVPTAGVLARIAEALGTSLDSLLEVPPKNSRRSA